MLLEPCLELEYREPRNYLQIKKDVHVIVVHAMFWSVPKKILIFNLMRYFVF